jgi:hypothetical protein
MKTQFFNGLFSPVFFLGFPVKAGKFRSANNNHAKVPPVLKPQCQLTEGNYIPAREPAYQDNSRLPASLEDWLACKAALEIGQSSRKGMEEKAQARLMLGRRADHAKPPPAAIAHPRGAWKSVHGLNLTYPVRL